MMLVFVLSLLLAARMSLQ